MANIIETLEKEQMKKKVPDFKPGDTVIVQVKVKEGTRERLQAFEGVVIGKRNRGLNSAFTVRKVSHGEGVERTFQTHSPLVDSITIKRRGDVRRAKLYYLRELSGRAARIKEKITKKGIDNTLLTVEPEEEPVVEETIITEEVVKETPIIEEKKEEAKE